MAELRGAGMSTRAIGAAVGVSEGTVRNDLSTAQDYAVETVTGINGKRYEPNRPAASAAEKLPSSDVQLPKAMSDIAARWGCRQHGHPPRLPALASWVTC